MIMQTIIIHRKDKQQGSTVQQGSYIQCLLVNNNRKEYGKEYIYRYVYS